MTQTQKIISAALKNADIKSGMKVYIKEQYPAISDTPFCGAYGRLYLKEKAFTVPEGVFINLDGALRNDAKSCDIAEYIYTSLKKEDLSGFSVEFGGDSMGYLTMDDRIEVVKALEKSDVSPFCVIFECDYITAQYTLETLKEKTVAFYNDGPQNFMKIITLDISKV